MAQSFGASVGHSYGFSNLILPLLLHGVPLILVGSALPEAVRLAAAMEDEVTLAAVPALWGKWHEADAIPGTSGWPFLPVPLRSLEQDIFKRTA